jgi:hypothetical protein
MPAASPAVPFAPLQPAGVVALSGGDTALVARAGSLCSYWQERVSRIRAAIREVKDQLETAHGARRQQLKDKLHWLQNQLDRALAKKRRYC